MRSIAVLILLAISLASCSEYQRVLKEPDMNQKYKMADSLYHAGKYRKSYRLFEQIVPSFMGTAHAERIQYLYASNIYKLKDYYSASYQYERYAETYPASDSAEVAAFRSVKSYYEMSPRYTIEQRDTYVALEKLQNYLGRYPDSQYLDEVNAMSNELQEKLNKKEFEIAKQYLRIMDYKAAISAFDNFIKTNLGSKYQEEAYLRRMEAALLLTKHSVPDLIPERLKEAESYYKEYLRYYKEAELSAEADNIYNKIKDQINKEATS